jgi:hypothetical protein
VSAECTALREKARSGGFEALSDADRAKMRECFAGMRRPRDGAAASPQSGAAPPQAAAAVPSRGGFGGGGFGGGRRRGTTRPGIVFVPGANGPEPRMVMLGVNDWDYTEVLRGLKEGDKVFLMTAARLQQQQADMQNRIRSRDNMGGMRQTPQQTQQPQGGGGPGR